MSFAASDFNLKEDGSPLYDLSSKSVTEWREFTEQNYREKQMQKEQWEISEQRKLYILTTWSFMDIRDI